MNNFCEMTCWAIDQILMSNPTKVYFSSFLTDRLFTYKKV